MIELNKVSITVEGNQIIEELSLSVQPNSMTFLISSDAQILKHVIHAICGLKLIDSGRIEVNGVGVPSDVIRKKMVCALERPAMNPILTPRQNLKHYLGLRDIERSVVDELDKYAERLLLHEFLDKLTSGLGAGIVRGFETLLAVIIQPEYFVQSDFTASFLSPYFRRLPGELNVLLNRGSCIVSSTPSFRLAHSLANHLPVRVAILTQSGLVIEGPIDRIIDHYSQDDLHLPEPDFGGHKNLEIERAIEILTKNSN